MYPNPFPNQFSLDWKCCSLCNSVSESPYPRANYEVILLCPSLFLLFSPIPVLPSLNSFCSLHNRPINRETSCWSNEQRLYMESQQPRRWQTNVLENHLPVVRIQASFILKGEGVWLLVANFWCQNRLFLHLSR